MAKVIALCGRICSGKTTYARELCKQLPAVSLSPDELTLGLFDGNLGDKHDEMCAKINDYLYRKAVETVRAGANVVLDSGFWQRSARAAASRYFAEAGVQLEWHCVSVDDETWRSYIAARNESMLRGDTQAYYVDEGLAAKCLHLYEPPTPAEMDVFLTNNGGSRHA